MIVSIWRHFLWLSSGKKKTSSFTYSIRYFKDIAYLLFSVLWASLLRTAKVMLSICRTLLSLSAAKKLTSSLTFFWRYFRYANLFFCYAHLNWSDPLAENLNVYLHPKNQLHNSLLSWDIKFLQIFFLQFDWPMALWAIIQEPEFYQIWDWWWNANNNISFHFTLFPGKTDDKIVQNCSNPMLEPFCALFCQIWAKMNFRGKKGSASF